LKKYVKYLRYVFIHKWYVFLECRKLGIPWLGIWHDWSKFLPDEFIPYARHFYGDGGNISKGRDKTGYYKAGDTGDEPFDRAWLFHQHRNRHHWQHWVLVQDEDEDKVMPMPDKYRREMLADWRGAGKAQGFGDNTLEWYEEHKDKMRLEEETRKWIKRMLFIIDGESQEDCKKFFEEGKISF
jgi:hypothetical protein